MLVDVPDGNDFYPRSPRGGRHKHYIIILSDSSISIHALREEGDHNRVIADGEFAQFLSTPSARRATDAGESGAALGEKFLSTPSARRATDLLPNLTPEQKDFYPRPPRGGRP